MSNKQTKTPVGSCRVKPTNLSPLYLPEVFSVKIPTNAANRAKLREYYISLDIRESSGNYYDSHDYICYEKSVFYVSDYRGDGPLVYPKNFMSKKLPFLEMGEWQGYKVKKNLANGNIHVGCQTFSAENLNKVFKNLNKNTVICDFFEDPDKVLIILPEKKQIWVYTEYGETEVFSIKAAEELKNLLKLK